MTDRVRITVSGLRGQVPEALNVDIVSRFASAFSTYLEKGGLALGRDPRESSPMLAMAARSSVMAAGLDCFDWGMLPTPCLQFAMRRESFSGGISVSGGHNPLPWNAVILLNQQGAYLETSEGTEVFNVFEAGDFQKARWLDLGSTRRRDFPVEFYLKEMSGLVDRERIRKSSFKVAADTCNGASSAVIKLLSDFFGLRLVALHDDPALPFPHPPEPSPAQAAQVEAVVGATGADMGILFNSDGSRLSFVTERGKALSEEMTLPLCLLSLQGRIAKVVTTLSTSRFTDWAAEKTGVKIVKTKVGQSAVVNTMIAASAEAGGEGSGSLAYAPFSFGYDAMLALVLVLDLLAGRGQSLSEVVSPFPPLTMKKIKIDVPPEKTYQMMDRLEDVYAAENPDFSDGIRIDREDVWFHIRPSMTEFILRLHIEGDSPVVVAAVEEEIRERIRF